MVGLYHKILRIVHIFRSIEFVFTNRNQSFDDVVIPHLIYLHQRFIGFYIPIQDPRGIAGSRA